MSRITCRDPYSLRYGSFSSVFFVQPFQPHAWSLQYHKQAPTAAVASSARTRIAKQQKNRHSPAGPKPPRSMLTRFAVGSILARVANSRRRSVVAFSPPRRPPSRFKTSRSFRERSGDYCSRAGSVPGIFLDTVPENSLRCSSCTTKRRRLHQRPNPLASGFLFSSLVATTPPHRSRGQSNTLLLGLAAAFFAVLWEKPPRRRLGSKPKQRSARLAARPTNQERSEVFFFVRRASCCLGEAAAAYYARSTTD